MAASLPPYYSKKLANGLEVVAIPLAKNGVVTTDIFYRVGSRNEVMGKSGIAHMLEHLNFKSTKNLKAGEFDEIVKCYGGINNASTGFDYTHYFIKSSRENMGRSLELYAEMMQHLLLLDEEFQPERNVVAEERRWRTDNNPMGYLYFRLFNTAYTYHPYHWIPIGFMEDITSWTIEDIRSFHRRYYRPSNAMIVVAGDVDPQELFVLAEKHFGGIVDNGEPIPPVHMKEPKQDGERRAIIHKESQTELLAMAWHIPAFDHPDMAPLHVIGELLGSGKSSRLAKQLIDKKQLVNQIYAYPMSQIDPGLFVIIAVCNEGVKAEMVEAEILKEIEKIKKGNISKAELDKVKVNTRSDFIFALEDSSSVADLYGGYLIRGNIDPLLRYEEEIEKMTRSDIAKVARTYFTRSNTTVVILRKKEDKQ